MTNKQRHTIEFLLERFEALGDHLDAARSKAEAEGREHAAKYGDHTAGNAFEVGYLRKSAENAAAEMRALIAHAREDLRLAKEAA